jgi:hypothetical protein
MAGISDFWEPLVDAGQWVGEKTLEAAEEVKGLFVEATNAINPAKWFKNSSERVKRVMIKLGYSEAAAGRIIDSIEMSDDILGIGGKVLSLLLLLLIQFAGTSLGLLGSVFEQGKMIATEANPFRPPPLDSIVSAYYRSFGQRGDRVATDAEWLRWFNRHGLDTKSIEAIKIGFGSWFTAESLSAFLHLDQWNDVEFEWWLKQTGVPIDQFPANKPEMLAHWRTLLTQPLDVNQTLEFARRSNVPVFRYHQLLRRLGYGPEEIERIDTLKENLLDVSTLNLLEYKGIIEQEEWNKQANRLGYKNENLARLWDARFAELPFEAAREGLNRGFLSTKQFQDAMRAQGMRERDVAVLNELRWQLPSPQDIVRFAVREIFSPEIAEKFGQYKEFPEKAVPVAERSGINEETLKQYWAAHWDLPSPGQGFDMFHRGLINRDELEKLLRALDVMPFWRDKMLGITYRLIPRRRLKKLVQLGVINNRQARERYEALGYSSDNARILTRAAWLESQEKPRMLSRAQAQDAFIRGWFTEQDLDRVLIDLNYNFEARQYYIADAKYRKNLSDSGESKRPLLVVSKEAREETIRIVLSKYAEGLISREEAVESLSNLGMQDKEIGYRLSKIDWEIQETHFDLIRRNIEKRFLAGVYTVDRAISELISRGINSQAATRLVDKWDIEKETDELVSEANPRNPSKTDWKDWLVKGIITAEDWAKGMKAYGYSEEMLINYYLEILHDMEG